MFNGATKFLLHTGLSGRGEGEAAGQLGEEPETAGAAQEAVTQFSSSQCSATQCNLITINCQSSMHKPFGEEKDEQHMAHTLPGSFLLFFSNCRWGPAARSLLGLLQRFCFLSLHFKHSYFPGSHSQQCLLSLHSPSGESYLHRWFQHLFLNHDTHIHFLCSSSHTMKSLFSAIHWPSPLGSLTDTLKTIADPWSSLQNRLFLLLLLVTLSVADTIIPQVHFARPENQILLSLSLPIHVLPILAPKYVITLSLTIHASCCTSVHISTGSLQNLMMVFLLPNSICLWASFCNVYNTFLLCCGHRSCSLP